MTVPQSRNSSRDYFRTRVPMRGVIGLTTGRFALDPMRLFGEATRFETDAEYKKRTTPPQPGERTEG